MRGAGLMGGADLAQEIRLGNCGHACESWGVSGACFGECRDKYLAAH